MERERDLGGRAARRRSRRSRSASRSSSSFARCAAKRRRLASLRDYLTLTKPRIMTLLLLTGAAGMFVGAQGVPPLGLFAVTMLGLALACGGASALNHVLDRDIDALMGSRTEERPVASGRVSPEQALEFGILLSAVSFALLASAVNVLTAVLALVGNLFYVLVYTRWLKRSTPQNIVIGGAAGAVPPLVGYAAATGSLALPALWLFLIVFLWTPPHFWALALMIKNAYAAAGVPMLPVVRGDRETARQIVLYSIVMVAFTVVRRALARPAVHGGGARARSGVRRARAPAPARPLTRPRAGALPLLAPLPRAALRGGCARSGAPLMESRARTAEPPLRLGAVRCSSACSSPARSSSRSCTCSWTELCTRPESASADSGRAEPSKTLACKAGPTHGRASLKSAWAGVPT